MTDWTLDPRRRSLHSHGLGKGWQRYFVGTLELYQDLHEMVDLQDLKDYANGKLDCLVLSFLTSGLEVVRSFPDMR
jgi:hypothetical protein